MAGKGNGYYGDFWLFEIDENLVTQWEVFFGTPQVQRGNAMVQTPDGGYAIAGETEAKLGSMASMWLVKTDSEGNKEWEAVTNWGADRRHAFKDVLLTEDDTLMAVARSQESGYSYMIRFVEYDLQGNELTDILTSYKGDTRAMVAGHDGGYVLVVNSAYNLR